MSNRARPKIDLRSCGVDANAFPHLAEVAVGVDAHAPEAVAQIPVCSRSVMNGTREASGPGMMNGRRSD